ncbi:MAG: hypothetical protein SGPRY_013989 [Prymnesium sp.]
MLRDSYDVIVIGGGPVGITAALRAAKLGHSAIVIDATPPSQFQFTGPTGLYSKALRDAALRIDVGVLRKMGIGDAACWAQISELVDSIRMKAGDTNAEGLSVSRIPHLRGRGSLLPSDGDELKVKVAFNEQRSDTVGGGNVILATGSKAVRLDHLGEAYTTLITHRPFPAELRVFDSDSIKLLSFLPRSVTIVGGGIIAVEFARIFAALGAKVTMCVRASDLPSSLARVGIDRELACTPLEVRFSLMIPSVAGIRILFDTEVASVHLPTPEECRKKAGATQRLPVRIDLQRTGTDEPQGRRPLMTDILFTATGRRVDQMP